MSLGTSGARQAVDTIELHFTLDAKHGGCGVRLEVKGVEPAEGESGFGLTSNTRIAEVVQRIDANDCSLDDLRDVGSFLWHTILPDSVRKVYTQIRDQTPQNNQRFLFRLRVPKELEGLPWEAIHDERQVGFLASHERYCVAREPPESITPPQLPDRGSGPLAVLVVIPAGSHLQVDHEWNNLNDAVAQLTQDRAIILKRMDERVTPDQLYKQLSLRHWDVVHFSGHGELDSDGVVRIRLNADSPDDQERWMEAETFASLFNDRGVRLVVLNCCLSAAPSLRRTLSGVGPFLIRHGVPAVVAMRYEIPDCVAIQFSEVFYRSLLGEGNIGRVDVAVEQARSAMYRNHKESTVRGFVTPVLYLSGGPDLFPNLPRVALPPPVSVSEPITADVPTKLVKAIRNGLCIPVIGPGFPEIVVNRSEPQFPSPKELLGRLGGKCTYPRLNVELSLCDEAGSWIVGPLFRRVCQYYERDNQRYELVEWLKEAYGSGAPPQRLRALAKWRVPAIFYCCHDGLMEKALTMEGREPQIVNSACQRAEMHGEALLLANLCGTLRDADSLVLTEEDFDTFLGDLGRTKTSAITNVMYGQLGRSLLVLGFSPRDQLIRSLAVKLLKGIRSRTQGPIFFVCADDAEAKDPYWRGFNVEWIIVDPDKLISVLTPIASGETQS